MNILTGNIVARSKRRAPSEDNTVVLVIVDDDYMRLSICELLESVGFEAAGFTSTQALMDANVLDRPGCMILDPGSVDSSFNLGWRPAVYPRRSFSSLATATYQ